MFFYVIPEAYSEHCQRYQLMTKIIYANYSCYLNISFSRSLLYEMNIMDFFNTGLIFTPEVFILYKKVWGARGTGAHEF